MYWHVFTDDNHIKIPKPYDIGFAFASIPVIIAEGIYTKHGEEALKDFMWGMKTMFSVGDISGLFQPVLDHMTNTNWMGSPIVPSPLLNVDDKSDQYTNATALLYKEVGKATGASPILMQHYVDGYLGLTAKMIEETIENLLWNEKEWGARPFAKNPLEFMTYRFQGKKEESRTIWSEKFYELKKKADGVKSSYDTKYKKAFMDEGKDIKEYMSSKEKQVYIALDKQVSKFEKVLTNVKNEVEHVTYDKTLSKKAKEERINNAYKAKREALQEVTTELETKLKELEVK